MHFRIQTTRPAAIDVLKRGIEDLEKLCDHTLTVFQVKLTLQFNFVLSIVTDVYLRLKRPFRTVGLMH
jgi:hypothetical protein